MSSGPERIVDLHTHLFNARCLPLAGIIANALKKDARDCLIARAAAKLLNALTEADYKEVSYTSSALHSTKYFIKQICQLTIQQLNVPTHFNHATEIKKNRKVQKQAKFFALQRILESEIYQSLRQLEEGLIEQKILASKIKKNEKNIEALGGWAQKIVKKALGYIQDNAIKTEVENYPAFFFHMLKAESRLAKNIFEAYGSNAQNMQIVHHMMDMQYAYAPHQSDKELKIVAPMYDFPSVQLRRMQKIQQNSKGKILGFAAFDPRRSDCIDVVKWACSMQFLGFKFYPAMGYKPIGNNDPSVEKNVNEFFKYCEEKGIPVFTHCTPLGFETKEKLGLNTNPDHWAKLLERYPRLNLCFGHGGGGYAVRKSKGKNGKESKTIYHGWTAKDVGEWEADNNFARKVSILCKKYENVYCELAYITELFEGKEKQQNASREALIENLQRAIEKPSSEEIYDFSLKVAYGSDWHMPSMVNHPRKYLEVFLDIFKQQNPKLKINQEDFFWKNAYKYLNLT